jgi:hypothetical protein
MKISKQDDKIIIDFMHRTLLIKDSEPGVKIECMSNGEFIPELKHLIIQNANFVYIQSKSIRQKIKATLKMIRVIWTKKPQDYSKKARIYHSALFDELMDEI